MWERHEEKWPASESSRADASTDEPGSWRGDAGHYLNAEENLVSDHALERTRAAEEKLTLKLNEIRREFPGTEFAGLDNRIKGEARFKEKIAYELQAKPERSIAEIAEHMSDALRYTFQIGSSEYTQGYSTLLGSLERGGYDMILSRNSWDNPDYKGVNTRWRSEAGQVFEIQFHTPESYEAKELTHAAYERLRRGSTADPERPELDGFQQTVAAGIPIPSGAIEIRDYLEAG
jgi:hypothetical protein